MNIISSDYAYRLSPPSISTRRNRLVIENGDTTENLYISACPHPFKTERLDFIVPVGLTIREIVDIIQIDPVLRAHGIVCLDDAVIPRSLWHVVRPKPGTMISVKILPQGGGGLRIAAMVAVAALAITATVLTGGLAGPLVGALVGAGISIGGGLLVNLLLPPPVPKMAKNYGNDPATYSITGQRNNARPWSKVPFLCGRFKITPPYAAMPYREVIGSDIYWRALFAIGHGPLYIENAYIGETLLGNFQGVEIEERRGYWSFTYMGNWNAGAGFFPNNPQFGHTYFISNTGFIQGRRYDAGWTMTYNAIFGPQHVYSWDTNQDKPFDLFPSDVYEDTLSVAVKYNNPQTRTTQAGADEVGIDLIFERGLVHLQNVPAGKRSDKQMTIAIQQAPTGTQNWANVVVQKITGRQTSPLYWGHRWRTTDFGSQSDIRQYDVRIYNLTGDMDEERNFGNFTWYALRTFTMQNPVPVGGIHMMALRIKASGQLTGVIDEFNVMAQTIAPDWNALANAWQWRITSSPAAMFRFMLQHPTRQKPAQEPDIDLDRLAYWDTLTRPANRNFNGVFDQKGSLYDALVEICRVGRASPSLRELRYSVIVDEPKTAPVRMFTPSNSWDYQGEMTHRTVPNAYRIGFINKEKGFVPQEVLVYDDGYDAGNATNVELVQWVGIDNNDQAWREGRYHLAQQRLRREVHKITADFEHLCCERGDLVALQYDTISVGSGSARVTSVTESGVVVSNIGISTPVEMQAGKSYNVRARRVVGNTQRTDIYNVITIPGDNTELTFSSPPQIIDAPDVGDLVAFGEVGRETLRAIVRDIEPKSDLSAVITLISEAPGVHIAEFGPIPAYDPVVTLPQRLPAPLVISIASDARVMMVTASRALIDRVVFALQAIAIDGAFTRVTYRLTGTDGAWLAAAIQDETVSSVAIVGPLAGESYDFRLQYQHSNYLASPVTSINGYYVVGRLGPPAPLENLSLAVIGGQALLRWDLPADLDVQIGGYILFRHSPDMDAALWPNTTSIAQAVVGDQTHVFLPLKPGTYFGRPYDADGRPSVDSVSISTKQAALLEFSPVGEVVEDPIFSGEKTNCRVFEDGITINAGDFDSIIDIDEEALWDIAGGVAPNAIYKFAAGIDFGEITKARVTSRLKAFAINELDFWDARSGNIDEWLDVDGTLGANVDAIVVGRLTDDNPTLNPSWSKAVRIDSMDITNRAIGEMECWLSTADSAYNIIVTELRVFADQASSIAAVLDPNIDGGTALN